MQTRPCLSRTFILGLREDDHCETDNGGQSPCSTQRPGSDSVDMLALVHACQACMSQSMYEEFPQSSGLRARGDGDTTSDFYPSLQSVPMAYWNLARLTQVSLLTYAGKEQR
jgi:hypothetical protein